MKLTGKKFKTANRNLINYNNERKNAKRVKHKYQVGDKVLMQRTDSTRKLERPYDGPFQITEVFSNGTVAVQKGIVNKCWIYAASSHIDKDPIREASAVSL